MDLFFLALRMFLRTILIILSPDTKANADFVFGRPFLKSRRTVGGGGGSKGGDGGSHGGGGGVTTDFSAVCGLIWLKLRWMVG